MKTFNIFYIGSINDTLVLLNKCKSLNIVGVNYSKYFNRFTINPIDHIFIIIYNLQYKNQHRIISKFLFSIWSKLYLLSSPLYINNREYLNIILNNDIKIIDTEDTESSVNFLIKNSVDLIIINSWEILPNKILNFPKYKTLNIHPSLLPQYRGALPTLWSLKNNDKISGVTYLILNENIDDGLFINQHIFNIDSNDNWHTLENKITLIVEKTLITDILSYLNGEIIFKEINNQNISYTGYYNAYRKIDIYNEYANDIFNKVGLYPYLDPFCYCYIQILNRKVYIKKTSIVKSMTSLLPDINFNFDHISFFTKNGILKSRLFLDIGFSDSIFIISNKIINKI